MTKSTVLILGAYSDIAQALANEFAASGYNLQLAARDPSSLNIIQSDLKIRHNIEVDLYSYDALHITNSYLTEFYNKLNNVPDIVISAVGLDHSVNRQLEEGSDPEAVQLVINTNFTGPAIALEYFASKLVSKKVNTTIIGISSVAGDRGRAKNYWYGAAKAGFTAVLSGLRQKYAHTNLLVMTVKPGFIATKMTRDKDFSSWLTVQPEDIAKLIIKKFNKRSFNVYSLKWRIIMLLIKILPERIFYKLKF